MTDNLIREIPEDELLRRIEATAKLMCKCPFTPSFLGLHFWTAETCPPKPVKQETLDDYVQRIVGD